MVLIGFEDPDLDSLVTSPTMCRRTRWLCSLLRSEMTWVEADMKAAFLQGPASQEARNLFAIPVPELAAAMGVPHGQAVQDTTNPKNNYIAAFG